ncbi:hypothetical protein ACQKWADRAFT_323767 [Trichoderma austrokoningii]
MESCIDKKEGLKDAIEMLNEMAAGAYRGADVARLCGDNNVPGLERDTRQLPPRPYEQDQLSLIKQIDKLKKEYGVRAATEPDDGAPKDTPLADDLQNFNPFTKPDPTGPARGQSQTWQREHLKSSDPVQRELDDFFEEEPTSRRTWRSNGPGQGPSRAPSIGSQPPRLQLIESQSFHSQVQQWQQARAARSQSGSQPGSEPSRPQSFRSQPPASYLLGSQLSGSQPPQSPRPPSQQSQQRPPQQSQQRPPSQQSQSQQLHSQPYQPQPQLRIQQRTNTWPRNQELQEVPREESAPSVDRPVETATYELDELPDKSGEAEGDQVEGGQAEGGQAAAEEAKSDEEKPFCSIYKHCVIGPFPGWNSRWFTRRGDDPGPAN